MVTPVEPEAARLVAAFVNTLDREEGRDELATPGDLAAWLRTRSLLGAEVSTSAADVNRAAVLRESLRQLLLANNGVGEVALDLSALNRCVDDACGSFQLRFEGDECVLKPLAEGFDAALAQILLAVGQAAADGSWARLKACADEECQWVFFDQSRNRAGHWCSMRSCGNRAKARQFRARRRSQAALPAR
ncbi:MAG: CGNR zinc finger domain-containing protein [Candidatus Dormibacteraeota bacterium]|nr:CGNR zinc finger domain-containing protein [Candidatus Dormibacteraeota bacterium]